jgi:hypothetical protein
MPVVEEWKRSGIYKQVAGLMPSVTNINNASICCGVYPEHGITGNTYFDEKRDVEDYMESADLLLAPTLFERAARHGAKSALLSSKAKTVTFLLRGVDIVLRLMASRIGDFVVWGDEHTLFGEMDMETETFTENLRSHGSTHELDIPLLVYNAKGAPSSDYFRHNLDLARWLYPA